MITVVAAIIEGDNKILLGRRKAGKHLAGYWEFPGGKIENNETPEECLKRELFEEFKIHAKVGVYIGEVEYKYETAHIKLLGYRTTIISGDFKLLDHDIIEWVELKDVLTYNLAPADIPLFKLYYNGRITETNY